MSHRCTMGSAWATQQGAVQEQPPYAKVPSGLLSFVSLTEVKVRNLLGNIIVLQKGTERIGKSTACAWRQETPFGFAKCHSLCGTGLAACPGQPLLSLQWQPRKGLSPHGLAGEERANAL